MSDKLTTRIYAENLRKLADYLDSIPEFEVTYDSSKSFHFYSKEKFVTAVKAVGNATKRYTPVDNYPELVVSPTAFPKMDLRISRDSVCKKIVTYDCEPLFSAEELGSL